MSTAAHGLVTEIETIRSTALAEFSDLSTIAEANDWEAKWLGAKGQVTLLMRKLGGLPQEERPVAGRATQQLRADLTAAFDPIRARLADEALNQQLASDAIDISLPGRSPVIGVAHPISTMIDE
jgi:phenylalanyl-tRNA synthetase alpha chain